MILYALGLVVAAALGTGIGISLGMHYTFHWSEKHDFWELNDELKFYKKYYFDHLPNRGRPGE